MRPSIVIMTLSLASLSPLAFADLTFEQELRQGCAKVKTYAAQGKKFYDQKRYDQAIVQFKQQAAWSSFCRMNAKDGSTTFTESEIHTAFNNVGLSYAKVGQPQWARAWFDVYPEAKSSQFNLKQLPAPQKRSDLSGKYVRYAGFGQWQTLTVKRFTKTYQIDFNGLYMGARSLIYGPNMGIFHTTMPVNASKAQYRIRNCKIELSFKFDPASGQQIEVKETNTDDCGFGHNVSAQGIYLKVE